jgi:C4-dicarboxylate transporter DctQ subunit
VYIFAEMATIAFACIALYWSLHTIASCCSSTALTPVLQVNKAWFEAAVPIGFSLVIYRSVQGLWRDIGDLRAGREPFAGKAMFEE